VIDVKWKKAPGIAQSISYPTVYRIFDDKEVMAYRVAGHTGSWTYRISGDNGKTWTGPKKDVTDLNAKGTDRLVVLQDRSAERGWQVLAHGLH
jgi:Neuraminidase (sialidase)